MKAIITDLDRTLLHTDKSISSFTKEILNRCKQKGILVMAATARPQRDMKKKIVDIDFDAMAVSNGARVVCRTVQAECSISCQSAERVLEALKGYPDFRITLETGDAAYSNVSFENYESIVCRDLVSVVKSENILKIIVRIDAEDTVEFVQKEIPSDLYYTVANGQLMQIMNRRATKWNGVKQMLSHFDISPCEAVYFGDDNDDIESIKSCGLGVAVSNAIPAVLEVADSVADSNDMDGVAKFIAENIL